MTATIDSDLRISLLEHLELPKAILTQLQETRLCNEMLDEAIIDLEEAVKILQKL